MKNKPADHPAGGPVVRKSESLFQIATLMLRNPTTVLPEEIEKELSRAVARWTSRAAPADGVSRAADNYSKPEMLMRKLKNMRRALIRREAAKMSAWIEKSGIRTSWPELPEYRIRRVAVRGLLIAFRTAKSLSDFHRRAPFYVEQGLRKFSCNSPHCWSFRINLKTGKSTCTRGDGRMF